jgi:hypothetical protein
MKVKIGYTIDLENVPREVSKFLADIKGRVDTLSSVYDSTLIDIKTQNISVVLKRIDGLRESLSFIDLRLSDAVDILSGYQKTIAMEQEKEEEKEKGVDNT